MHIKKHLGFDALIETMSMRFGQVEDTRKGKIEYSLHDCLMGGFAMMFLQDPSMLEFQRRFQRMHHRNNLKTIFGILNIPKDSQLRDVLDNCSPEQLNPVFTDFFRQLQKGKQLELYRFLDDYYLMSIDGSEYFSSENISCSSCLTKKTEKDKVRYHHQILQPVIVCPGIPQVIPLAPEPIQNTDGTKKQDCEINAGKRLVHKVRKAHPKLKIIITGDDLYSKQPFIDELKKARISFILVAKSSDHKILYEWFSELKQLKGTSSLHYNDPEGRQHFYEWVNDIPLNGTIDADNVNYFQYTLTVDGKVNYHNSWVTDIPVTRNNVSDLVKAGRARWKIENEGFNTLKNQGYHIEHNFGHGKKNLSMIFFILNLLAYFVHQILELTDSQYQQCRATFSSRMEFWNQIRCTLRIIIFESWQETLSYIFDPPQARAP